MSSVTMSPGTMADDATVGTVAWSNPDNAKVSDNVYATATGAVGNYDTHYLEATNFGFSIPSEATINGIVVEFEQKASIASTVFYSSCRIVKGGSIGLTGTGGAYLTLTEAYLSMGSPSDLWGESWTPSDINDLGFGTALHINTGGDNTAYVDHIRITVYYTGPTMTGVQSITGVGSITL